jgi:nucleotide-binding universal stress UspA family protein
MFKRFLVPLDGSHLAESVLPVTLYFAAKFSASIMLFHALEQAAPSTVHGERHLADPREAEVYLNEIAARLSRPNIAVTKHLHTVKQTDVAHTIIEHAIEYENDLVVMCAHGSGGWRARFVSNIAQQVVARGTTPVLFVNPERTVETREYECRKILLPLDGTPQHEPALPVARQIAQTVGASMRLVTVVPTTSTLSAERAGTGTLLPNTMAATLELSQQRAIEYLEKVVSKLSAGQVQATAEVARGEVAAAILDAEDRAKADLVVLATHGRSGVGAFWSGSVTPKVLMQSHAPVLLVRMTTEETER